MEDQNIWYAVIDLIKSALPIIGTLGGALGGAYFQNKFSTEKEEKKLKREKIEQSYKSLFDTFLETISHYNTAKNCLKKRESVELPYLDKENIPLLEAQKIVDLYLPEFNEDFNRFRTKLHEFITSIDSITVENMSGENGIKSLGRDLEQTKINATNEFGKLINKLSEEANKI